MSSIKCKDVFDLAVIGAGPGGSNTASVALRGGLTVVQIEKYRFPRIKPCAGGLTCRSLRSLDLDLQRSLRTTFRGFQFNLYGRDGSCFDHSVELLHMVYRPQFDNDLVKQNLGHPNFMFFDGEPVRRISYSGGFHIETTKRRLKASQLVGADGAYSLVNRIFGVAQPAAKATAVEVTLQRKDAQFFGPDLPCFDWGVIPLGYGWVFPKDDHWSVGLYTLQRGLRRIREQLSNYIAVKGFRVSTDPLASFEAHQLPIGGYRLRRPKFPLYLVGDAGGFADAITGEGIYHALESGRLAGETAVEVSRQQSRHGRYYRRLWNTVLVDTLLTYRLAGPVYRRLERSLKCLRVPAVWRPLVEGFARGATISHSLAFAPYYWARSYRRAYRKGAPWMPARD